MRQAIVGDKLYIEGAIKFKAITALASAKVAPISPRKMPSPKQGRACYSVSYN